MLLHASSAEPVHASAATPISNTVSKPLREVHVPASCPPSKRILFLIGRGGGGHKASARALLAAARDQGLPWADDVEMIDVGYLIESFVSGKPPRTSGFDGDELYNWLMKRGFYRLAALSGPVAQLGSALIYSKIMRGLVRFWREKAPRLVCSFVPFFNDHFRTSLLRAGSEASLFTVVTDFQSNKAHMWIPKYDPATARRHIIVAGSADLQRQCRELGYPPENVLNTSGMVLHPAFCGGADNEAVALKDGCEKQPRALIFFGGFAPNKTRSLVKRLRASHPELELVVLCGGNESLKGRLVRDGQCAIVEGMVPPGVVARHMRESTFVIGKPGPGAVSEAAACKTPFVMQHRSVMAQEKCVLQWVDTNGLGVVVNRLSRMPRDVCERAIRCTKAIDDLAPNRAVLEVVAACGSRLLAVPEPMSTVDSTTTSQSSAGESDASS